MKYKTTRVRLEFKPNDVWIGAYWVRNDPLYLGAGYVLHIFICLIPMLPIHIIRTRDIG